MKLIDIAYQITQVEYIYIGMICALFIILNFFLIQNKTKSLKRALILSTTTLIPIVIYFGTYLLSMIFASSFDNSFRLAMLLILLSIHSLLPHIYIEKRETKDLLLIIFSILVTVIPIAIFFSYLTLPLVSLSIPLILDILCTYFIFKAVLKK